MPPKAKTDWASLDWQRPTPEIAKSTGAALNTVAKARGKYAPETVGLFRDAMKFSEDGKARQIAQASINGVKNQPLATEGAKRSLKAGRGVGNVHAKEWVLVSPDNVTYAVTNLYQFVRDRADLFGEADTAWKRRGGGRGTGGEYCNATAGLANIRGGKTVAWKGWRLGEV